LHETVLFLWYKMYAKKRGRKKDLRCPEGKRGRFVRVMAQDVSSVGGSAAKVADF
jgi:hypothetical protein